MGMDKLDEFLTHAGAFLSHQGSLARIDQKIHHARQRSAMSPRLLERLADIAKEIASGRYWRYSYGIRSVAQDLWLRG